MNENQKYLLNKKLIIHQQQAYEGAKLFYYGFLPITLLFTTGLYLYLYEQTTTSQNSSDYQQIFFYIILVWISYALATRVYIKCNTIDVTPKRLRFISNISETGQITESNIEDEIQLSQLSIKTKPQKKQCVKCNIICDYRTKHCRKCQVCVQRYDHHCFWIGNCVGRKNHKYFYYFLFFQTCTNFLGLHIFYYIPYYFQLANIKFFWILNLCRITLLIMTFGFILFTGYLLIYHTMLIVSGITTWEHMKKDRITYLKYLPPGYNPFSHGPIQNIITFFKQNQISRDDQLLRWDKYLPTFQQAKTLKPAFNLIENEYYSCC